MIIPAAILASFLLFQTQGRNSLAQISSGWCSPNVANVSGNVTITCIGVDPGALVVLNRELRRKRIALEDKIREANDWADRYHHLLEASGGIAASRRVRELLKSGQLDQAGAILDRALKDENEAVIRIAADNYARGSIYLLQFRSEEAIPYLKRAYEYQPDNIEYAIEYGGVLLHENKFSEAEKVLGTTYSTARTSLHRTDDETRLLLKLVSEFADLYVKTGRANFAEPLFISMLDVEKLRLKAGDERSEQLIIGIHSDLGVLYRNTGRFDQAEREFRQALEGALELSKNSRQHQDILGAAQNNLAAYYVDTQRYDEASKLLQGALETYRNLNKAEPRIYEPELARVLENLGTLYSDMRQSPSALRSYEEALAHWTALVKVDGAYRRDLARALNNMGTLNEDVGREAEAEENYRAALRIRLELARTEPLAYRTDVVRTLLTLGDSLFRQGKVDKASVTFGHALLVAQSMDDAPRPDNALLSDVFRTVGEFYLATGDLNAAEKILRESLKFAKELSSMSRSAGQSRLGESLNDLFRTELLLNHLDEAKKYAEEAVSLYRDLRASDSSINSGAELGKSLLNLAEISIKESGYTKHACNLIDESLPLLQDFSLRQHATQVKQLCSP